MTVIIGEVKNEYKFGNGSKDKSYPFLDATKVEKRKGSIANSTTIAPNISLHETSITPNPKYPTTALGFAGITHVEGISDILKGQLKRHAPDLKVSFRPANKVSQVFSNMKDKLETGQNSNVVYSVRCKQCGYSYIGETSRCLSERCTQHAKDVANRSKNPKKTALVAHVSDTQHEFDVDTARILKKVQTRGL